MKVNIEYDLHDEFEKLDALKVIKAANLVTAIEEIMTELRRMTKYETCDDDDLNPLLQDENTQKVVEHIRQFVHNQLIEQDIGELF
jgi:hypothetical protein